MKIDYLQQYGGIQSVLCLMKKSDRETLILYAITYMWNLKNKWNITKWKQTQEYKEHTSGYYWEERWRRGQIRLGY